MMRLVSPHDSPFEPGALLPTILQSAPGAFPFGESKA